LWYYHIVEFIESRVFTRQLRELAGDRDDDLLRAIQEELRRKPDRGALVPGLGGVRKARIGNPRRGKGKRGGLRYLYVLYLSDNQIGLLYLLDKDEQEDLNAAERKLLRELAAHGN
jgi:hypothetical protein